MPTFGSKRIDVVILCGGLGTRLGSEANNRPKPMVDINGKPFLDILIGHVVSFDFTKIVLCTGHKSQFIEDYYSNQKMVPTLLISEEKTRLGTGGALKNAENLIQSDSFIALNGDSFCPVPLKEFCAFHHKKKSQLSIALTHSKQTKDFGSVMLNESNEIVGFDEKSPEGKPGLVNSGVYIFNKSLLAQIESEKNVSLEYDLFPSLVGNGMFGYVTEANLLDIGTPEKLSIARNLLV
jgi:D-glycero-alpha-D-manno-heptose 1-phosphate guanylyltransferase